MIVASCQEDETTVDVFTSLSTFLDRTEVITKCVCVTQFTKKNV